MDVLMVRYIARRLDGYKSIIGGTGLFLLGIIKIILMFFPEFRMDYDLEVKSIENILGTFSAAAVGVGLAGKGEKIKRAIMDREYGPDPSGS